MNFIFKYPIANVQRFCGAYSRISTRTFMRTKSYSIQTVPGAEAERTGKAISILQSLVLCSQHRAWVLDSLERLAQANALEPSRIYNFDQNGSVYTRAEM